MKNIPDLYQYISLIGVSDVAHALIMLAQGRTWSKLRFLNPPTYDKNTPYYVGPVRQPPYVQYIYMNIKRLKYTGVRVTLSVLLLMRALIRNSTRAITSESTKPPANITNTPPRLSRPSLAAFIDEP